MNQNGQTVRSTASPNGAVYQIEGSDCNHIILRVQEIANRRNWPMAHVSLAWLNRRVTAPIIGFSSVERIDEALEARGKELSREEEEYLEAVYRPKSIQGHS